VDESNQVLDEMAFCEEEGDSSSIKVWDILIV